MRHYPKPRERFKPSLQLGLNLVQNVHGASCAIGGTAGRPFSYLLGTFVPEKKKRAKSMSRVGDC